MHEHGHAYTPGQEPSDPAQLKALLKYMIHHNEHHAEELADLLDQLEEKPRKKLLMAIGTFEAANVELQEVLECLE